MNRPTDTEALRGLREQLADLEHRGRAVETRKLRHDVANAVGAARNALTLVDENPAAAEASRFIEIAHRNIERATELLRGTPSGNGIPAANAPPDARSGRNEGNDLGSADERNHRDALGL